MKTIIVATDYSSNADNALQYAAALARFTNSKIVLFNSFKLPLHAANTLLPASSVDEMVATSAKRLKNIAFHTSNTYGIIVDCITRSSFIQEELDYQVKRLQADLVVMGMCEAHSVYENSNTTTSIIRHANYPVLVVPDGASFKGISKILFAFDTNCIHAANKLGMLKEVAAFFNAQVEVYHVEKSKKLPVETLIQTSNTNFDVDKLLNDIMHSYKDAVEHDIVKGIEKEIKDVNADLLVMVPHKYSFWQSILHKSKTSTMACRTCIPLLSLPNPSMA